MIPDIYNLLKDSAPITNIVGNRIYKTTGPQNVSLDSYIIWKLPFILPENTISETPDIDRVVIEVICYHVEDKNLTVLTKAVRDSLELVCYMIQSSFNDRDEKTKLYSSSSTFEYLLNRE